MLNKTKNILLLIILSVFIFNACEEVIDIDFEELDQQIVVEGIVADNPEGNIMKLGISQTIFQSTQQNAISKAVISVADNDGKIVSVPYTGNGYYNTSGLKGTPGKTYHLSVDYNGKTYTAQSTMPEPMSIDSIKFWLSVRGVYPFTSSFYKMSCYITNQPGIEEYCLIKIKGGNYTQGSVSMLYQDKYSDGKQIVMDNVPAFFEEGENVVVEIFSIDKEAYNYYYQLKDITSEDGIEVPDIVNMNSYNPKSNISNNALGFFGAFAYKKYDVQVK